jgi:hypothetical protein
LLPPIHAREVVGSMRPTGLTRLGLRDVEAILDAHYLGRDVKLAEISVMKLETRANCKTHCKTCAVRSL